MKNYRELFNKVMDYYKESFLNKDRKSIEIIAKVEIFIYILDQLGFQDKDISKSWTLLNGYHFNEGFNINIDIKEFDLINKVRGFINGLNGATTFRNYMEVYNSYSEINKLLYTISIKGDEIKYTSNSSKSLEKRKNIISNLFNETIDIKENNISTYKDEEGIFLDNGLVEKVYFKKCKFEAKEIDRETINRKYERNFIKVSKKELLETARYIDSRIENKNYLQRVSKISFDVLEDKTINESEDIIIDGLFNLVGRVGAGKSTLVEVLTCKLALEGRKVAIIVDSIKSIVELVDYFEKLDILAVPIWSYSGREGQINKVYSSIIEEDFNDIDKTSWNKWFSETCILDGLRDTSDIVEPLKSGSEPCLRISKTEKGEKYVCPYYHKCPSHIAERSFSSAQVYITTPAAFLKSKISPAVVKENVRVSEYLYYKCDLVVFDESDRVQLNFDGGFIDHLTLMDESNQSYLNKLGNEVSSWFYKNRLENASNKAIHQWYDYFTNTQRIADIMIQLLNDNTSLIKKLNGTFSTALSLHGRFMDAYRGNKEKIRYKDMELFINKGEDQLDDAGNSIRMELLSGNIEYNQISNKIYKWYFNDEKASNDELLMIEFIFILNIFEKNFRKMVNGIEEIPELESLNLESTNVINKGIEDYMPFIPTSPMGNMFGIRVTANDKGKLKRLVIFKSRGLGRWLLTNYHKIYEGIDYRRGPNVLLLSGTSWAPKSYSYHIDRKVDAILNGDSSETIAIENSEFFFEPILVDNKAVYISGTDLEKRKTKLNTIVNRLIEKSKRSNKSKLSRELELLEEDRKRILLLVGSYDEAASIKSYLNSKLNNEGEIRKSDVCLLVKDDKEGMSDEDITRGDVAEFGIRDKKILIAPMLSLERGYNILNKNSKAAIGSVYFLVRPMPVPNDISIIINKINSNCISQLNRKKSEDIIEHVKWVKENRDNSLRLMQNLLIKSERLGYRQLEEKEREELCMTLFVTMCQVIGRLIRGGCKARVHFCDAKFAPKTVINEKDTAKTSILVGIIESLDKLINSEEIIEKEISTKLYYSFYKGLKECEGLSYGK